MDAFHASGGGECRAARVAPSGFRLGGPRRCRLGQLHEHSALRHGRAQLVTPTKYSNARPASLTAPMRAEGPAIGLRLRDDMLMLDHGGKESRGYLSPSFECMAVGGGP